MILVVDTYILKIHDRTKRWVVFGKVARALYDVDEDYT